MRHHIHLLILLAAAAIAPAAAALQPALSEPLPPPALAAPDLPEAAPDPLLLAAGLAHPPAPARWSPAWLRIRAAEATGDQEALLAAYKFYAAAKARRAAFEKVKNE